MKLSEEQKAVVESPPGARMLVEAVPGAGKTEVLARRLEHLIKQGMGPAQVMVLSFSNAAVRTLVSRLRKIARARDDIVDDLRHVSVRTFDSWAFRLLIASGKSYKDLLRTSYEDNILAATDVVKAGRGLEPILAGVRHVFIDEVQDLTGARADLAIELLRHLSAKGTPVHAGFTVLGDKHQGIYGFSVSGQEKHPAEFIDRVVSEWGDQLETNNLTVNYRLAKEMEVSAADARRALDARNGAKALEQVRKIVESFPKLAGVVEEEPGSTAILCRTNAQALMVAEEIWGRGEVFEGQFPFLNAGDQYKSSPAWIGRLLSQAVDTRELTRELFIDAYAALLSAEDSAKVPDAASAWAFLQKCLKCPPDAVGMNLDRLRERLSWADFLPDDESAPPDGSLEITTIHQSKGREYDNVVMLDGPLDKEDNDDRALREEARLLYVGMTRSRRFVKVWVPDRSMSMFPAELWKSRTRLIRMYKGAVVIEGGMRRDINPTSFIDKSVICSESSLLQQFLWENKDALVGRKVVLVKAYEEGPVAAGEKPKAYYRICLQKDGKPDIAIGGMSAEFREEVLGAYSKSAKRYSLPACIYNLRISSVCTYSAKTDELAGKSAPWSASGFWLGVGLTGLAYFKTFRS